MKHPFQEINKELRDAELIGIDAPLPEYTGRGQVGLLVGLQDVSLDSVLIGVLPSVLGVYQCPFLNVWGSSIAYAGPHPTFRAPLPQEFRASFMIERTEQLSRPEKTCRRKRRFRRRPCLCPLSPSGWGGDNRQQHGHRHHHQIQQQCQKQETPRLTLGSRS